MNSLGVRVASALVALGLFFGSYKFFGNEGLVQIVTLIALIGANEYLSIVEKISVKSIPGIEKFLIFALVIPVTQFRYLYISYPFIIMGLFLLVAAMIFESNKSGNLKGGIFRFSLLSVGLVYVGVLPGTVGHLIGLENGFQWLLTLLMIVFIGDTSAYFVGLSLGKKKILPNISPKKSWWGCIGGLTGSCVAGYFCWNTWHPQIDPGLFLAVSLTSGLFAQTGDFFESTLKRAAGVKDSGNIMPGHGGALDRIDGVLFAAPVLLWLTINFS